jgi:hypothetical protein
MSDHAPWQRKKPASSSCHGLQWTGKRDARNAMLGVERCPPFHLPFKSTANRGRNLAMVLPME